MASQKKKNTPSPSVPVKIAVIAVSVLLIAAVVVGIVFLIGSLKEPEKGPIDLTKAYTKKLEAVDHVTNYIQIELDCGAYIVAELYPDIAPITVANIQKLVSEKFYDNIIFHRVIKDFMIQAGDPTGTGSSGSGETIVGEFSANGIDNPLSHTRGVLSMARRSGDNDSASSQFFIVHKDYPSLDGSYAAFGKVIRGMETVDAIAEAETGTVEVNGISVKDHPLTDIKIKTISFVEIG